MTDRTCGCARADDDPSPVAVSLLDLDIIAPDFWLNLQRMYDLDVARAKTDVSAIEPLVEVSA